MHFQRFIATTAVSLLVCSAAGAQQTSSKGTHFPSVDEIRPLPASALTGLKEQPFLHDFRLMVEGNYGEVKHKAGQPANLSQRSTGGTIGLSFGIGERGFAAIQGSYTSSSMTSTVVAFPLNLTADATGRGIDAMIGFRPTPFTRMGIIGGVGNGNAGYTFVGFGGGSGSTSKGTRIGGFVGASYPAGPVVYSADLAYLNIRNTQTYDPTNVPPTASWGSEIASLTLGASYQVAPRLNLTGGVGLNHILSQRVAPADTPNDVNWISLQLGATYALTDRVDIKLSGVAWLDNSKFSYHRVSTGLVYKF